MKLYAPPFHYGEPTPGWRVGFYTPDGQVVPTVSHALIHVELEHPIWAELTMFADADERPVLTLPPGTFAPAESGLVPEGDSFRERAFPYLIEFITEPASVAAQ